MDSKIITDHSGQIHTVQTMSASEPAFSEGSIRWTIYQFKSELLSAGAIFYCGRKLLIDRDCYISFLKGENNDK